MKLTRQYENLQTFKRHFGLSIRRTTSTAQFLPVDADLEIREWHHLLLRALLYKKPTKLWILDETSVRWHPPIRKVLAPKNSKHVKGFSPNDKLASTGLLVGECDLTWPDDADWAKGSRLPTLTNVKHHAPHVIFKNGWKKNVWKQLRNSKATGTCTESGWMTTAAMLEWIELTLPFEPGTQVEGWLIMDIFSAHKAPEVLAELKRRNITPFFIPAGLTSLLQVHDTHINKSFKEEMAGLQESWNAANLDTDTKVGRENILAWTKAAIARVPASLLKDGILKNVFEAISLLEKRPHVPGRPEVIVPEKKTRGAAKAAMQQANRVPCHPHLGMMPEGPKMPTK